MAVLKIRDPADPTGNTWLDITGTGQKGDPGTPGGPVPVGGDLGEIVVKTGPADGEVGWETPPVLRDQIRSHFIGGPTTSSYASWTWTLTAGAYLCMFQMSAVATAAGIRYCNLNMNGAQINQSKFWFNVVNQHATMTNGVRVVTIPTDGDYDFDLTVSSSAAIDANDFGHCTFIPAALGAVS